MQRREFKKVLQKLPADARLGALMVKETGGVKTIGDYDTLAARRSGSRSWPGRSVREIHYLDASGRRIRTRTGLARQKGIPAKLPVGSYIVQLLRERGEPLERTCTVEEGGNAALSFDDTELRSEKCHYVRTT